MNLEIPTQMKHGTEPGDECADAERSAMPRVFWEKNPNIYRK